MRHPFLDNAVYSYWWNRIRFAKRETARYPEPPDSNDFCDFLRRQRMNTEFPALVAYYETGEFPLFERARMDDHYMSLYARAARAYERTHRSAANG